jgi:transposase
MPSLDPRALLPPGLLLDAVEVTPDTITISARREGRTGQAAVRAALTEPWSNGPTEGHITRLKLLRRQMHGRGKLDFLRARLVAPA